MFPRTKSIRNVGIYQTNDNIVNLKLRVTVKKLNSLIRIPKFEAIVTNEQETNIQDEYDEESRELQWQEKRLSNFEINSYKLRENCTTDLQKSYHQLIVDNSLAADDAGDRILEPDKIFTYCHSDNFVPLNEDGLMGKSNILYRKIEKFNRESNNSDDDAEIDNPLASATTSDAQILERYRYANLEDFESMYIMADLNPAIILFTIKYRPRDGVLIVCPDFNDVLVNPYYIEVDSDSRNMYHYGMRNISKNQQECKWGNHVQDNEIIEKLTRLSLLEDSESLNFKLPPTQKAYYHIFLEIQTAENFEYDNIHVRYVIQAPKFSQLLKGEEDANPLIGSTHSSLRSAVDNLWKFGHCHEVSLCVESTDANFENLRLSFEVISVDSWTRERTEGFAAIVVPLQPQVQETTLECYRIVSDRQLYDKLERYFVGGRRENTTENVNNRYGNRTITTGNLKLKIQIIKQNNSYDTLNRPTTHSYNRSGRGDSKEQDAIDKIIKSYERARQNLERLQYY